MKLYTIKFKIEGHRVRKPFVCYAESPGLAYKRARVCVPRWITAKGWQPGMLTK